MINEKKFKEYITLFSEKYQINISNTMSSVIWIFLKDHSDQDSLNAMSKVLIEGRFYKDLLPDLKMALQKSIKIDPITAAWIKVDDAMRKYGPYESIDFGDKKIHKTIEHLGGWEYLSTLDEDEWKWKRKEFESIYSSLKDNIGPDYVIGIFESQNKVKKIDYPIKILKLGLKQKQLVDVCPATK